MVYNPTPDKILTERKKFFKSFCSDLVADWLIRDRTLSFEQKKELIKKAKQIAFQRGHLRIYWEDFCLALRDFKSGSK
jgi:hypothetical protein